MQINSEAGFYGSKFLHLDGGESHVQYHLADGRVAWPSICTYVRTGVFSRIHSYCPFLDGQPYHIQIHDLPAYEALGSFWHSPEHTGTDHLVQDGRVAPGA